ncbi:GntR family transcriptional regulator [Paracoccus sp. (in: a-proteobacteria)]|uniref:GntR family transcriptional regulator n=1 Tax=Paracoccus sp. TaxID=267 RepID=UPI003A8A67DF
MTESLPRYRALAEQIRQDYLGGAARPGDRLPPEAEFSRRFGVARGTVVRAIEVLVAEGALVRRQGSGTFVSDPGLRRRQGRVQSFTESMRGLSRQVSHQVLSVGPVGGGDARALGSTEAMVRLSRLRFLDLEPVALHVSQIPESLFTLIVRDHGDALVPGARTTFSLYAALEEAGHPVARASERNVARLASDEEAGLLRAAPPVAVMEVWRNSRDATGRLIDATRALYLPGNYSVDIELVRQQAGG